MTNNKTRIPIIDEIRGFCVICMMIYHLCFVLRYTYDVEIPLMFDGWFMFVQQSFAGVFILISGIVSNFSRNNLRRGVLCFFAGMAVTFVTAVVVPSAPVYFGILHCLGVSMMIYGLCGDALSRLPWLPVMIIWLCAFALTVCLPRLGIIGFPSFGFSLPEALYGTELLLPLGIIPRSFATIDYFPLIPWFFLFLAGTMLGVPIKEKAQTRTFRSHCKPLAFVGRHALLIYLAHQPVIMLILSLFMKQKSNFIV